MESILNPSIFIGDLEWQEPVTSATDFLVAIVCWTAFYLFIKLKTTESPSYPWFKRYFLMFAIGMTSAAWLGHGLQAYLYPEFKLIGWVCAATGLMFLQIGTYRAIFKPPITTFGKLLPKWFVIQWLTAVICMLYYISEGMEQAFKVTQINSVIALWGFVLPMHVYALSKLKMQASKIVIIALLYSAIPGFIYSNKMSYSKWFNYHDISHVLMAIFMTAMFLGLYQMVKPRKT
jgi:hypothetical protein